MTESSMVGGTPAVPLVSLIIPMFNERDGLEVLFSALRQALTDIPASFEVVVVDDGSSDGTAEAAAQMLRAFPRWQLVSLSRNFGQQAAYRAGLEVSHGDAVVFLDADLQDPPHLIGAMVAQWQKGYRVVTAVRTSRAERGPRRLAFSIFHYLFHRLTGGVMPENSGMFSLLDRVVVQHLVAARETNLFLPALKNWFGYSQTTITYGRAERAVGEPKQSFRKLLNYALNGIISFSEKPLEWIGLVGLVVSIASFGYAAVLVLVKLAQLAGYFSNLEVQGFTTLAAGMFCLSGVQLCCLGIVGQYIARVYREVKQRPLYVIEKVRRSNEP